MVKKSDKVFGVGFVYNLVLFAKHYERAGRTLKDYADMQALLVAKKDPMAKSLFTEPRALSIWFNGAADHMFDLTIPKQWQKKRIGKLATLLQSQALTWRMSEVHLTKKSFAEFWDKLELLARLIDKELGVKTVEAQWK